MTFSSDNLYTGKEYFQKNPGWGEAEAAWKADKIHQLLLKNNVYAQTIVEVGCGTGGILRELSQLNPAFKKLTGFDISPQAIALAREKETDKIHFIHADLLSENPEKSDVVLVIDVLEHVDDYYGFLNKIRSKGEYFIFHIPLDLSCRNILKPHTLSVQRDNVGHIHYFTKDIIAWALKDTGFETIDWLYTKPLPDTMPVKGLRRRIKKLLRNISFSINKNLSVKLWGDYSILLLAK